MEFLDIVFWNNTILNYLISAAIIIFGSLILLVIKRIVIRRLVKQAEKTKTEYDDVIVDTLKKYLMPILDVAVFYIALHILNLPDLVQTIVNYVFTALVMVIGAILLSGLATYLFRRAWKKRIQSDDVMSVRWISVLIRVIIWTALLLIYLDNIPGFEVTTLIASLGIGGIAIAFAAQAVLEDIFSFITIFFDRPFEIDDFITIGDMSGTVEHIGIKTTRIRSLSGEQLIFSNKDLTSSRLRNYKRMQERRVVFGIGVTYNTTAAELKEVPDLIRDIIEPVEDVSFGRAHFRSFGDFSLNFEVVFFVASQDYDLYMDVLQKINLGIKEAFDARGLEFAFPTQTLYLEKEDPAS